MRSNRGTFGDDDLRCAALGCVLVLVVLALALVASVANGMEPFECAAVAPFTGEVAAEVWWSHPHPSLPGPGHWWGWYIPPAPVIAGSVVTVRPEGHPVQATIGFTGVGGFPYAETRCGIPPWEIFSDGFESGDTAAWTITLGATALKRWLPPAGRPPPLQIADLL